MLRHSPYNYVYTGTIASIDYVAQWQGAGVAEMLKNGEYGKLMSPMTYKTAPYGDKQADYNWNTLGMTMAAIRTGNPTPSEYLKQKAIIDREVRKLNLKQSRGF